ncbi:PRC-barrel domain-containing protein [Fulvimarina sp. MAC3]|uniref:PRC-barrel domain-containing protein n=1 Tax=Fulvimarina sp. MAC3 TaxID=3148887 RepID=UPI0031FD8B6E
MTDRLIRILALGTLMLPVTSANAQNGSTASQGEPEVQMNGDRNGSSAGNAEEPSPTTASSAISTSVPMALADFDIAQYAGGFTAERLLSQTVRGESGERVGMVRNVVVDADSEIDYIVVENEGLLGLGESVIAIPFEDVDLTPGVDGITVPVSGENIGDFSLFGGNEAPLVTGESYRIRNVIGDYVRLNDGTYFGYVKDVAFSEDGSVEGLIVTPDVSWGSGGAYGIPYQVEAILGTDYDTANSYFTIPYSPSDLEEAEPFDYEMFNSRGQLADAG